MPIRNTTDYLALIASKQRFESNGFAFSTSVLIIELGRLECQLGHVMCGNTVEPKW